jgi:hypothetical protein
MLPPNIMKTKREKHRSGTAERKSLQTRSGKENRSARGEILPGRTIRKLKKYVHVKIWKPESFRFVSKGVLTVTHYRQIFYKTFTTIKLRGW